MYCVKCGHEFGSDAPFCSRCGTARAAGPAGTGTSRNVWLLMLIGVIWTAVFWFVPPFVVGFFVGAIAPDSLWRVERSSEIMGVPLLLAALVASVALTVKGKLPGTRWKEIRHDN